VRSIRLADGSAVRPDGRYTLILNDFLVTGGDGLALASTALRTEVLPIVDLDALVAYLASRPQPVQPPRDVRLVATGAGR
jgi:hypothetical protein